MWGPLINDDWCWCCNTSNTRWSVPSSLGRSFLLLPLGTALLLCNALFTHLSSQLHVPALRKSIGRRRRPWIFTFHMVDNLSSFEILESMKRSGWLQQGQCGTEDASGLSHHNYPPAPDKKGHFPMCQKCDFFQPKRLGFVHIVFTIKRMLISATTQPFLLIKKDFPISQYTDICLSM